MALLEVAQHVNKNEPDTVSFYISQDINDPSVFTTYERFASKSAMETHNGSTAVQIFFDKKIEMITKTETKSKRKFVKTFNVFLDFET